MGLGNGYPKSGDKGSNHNFEHRHLLLLGELLTAITGTGGVPPTTGLATEATLTTVAATLSQILAEDQVDFELKAIQDANGDIFQLRGALDEATGIYTWDYIDSLGNAYAIGDPGGPVAPVQFVNLSGLLAAIEGHVGNIETNTNNLDVTLSSRLNTLGQKLSVASAPVVLSTEQETLLVDIEAAITALASSGLATEATLAAINGKFNTLGQKASANSHPVVLSTEQEALLVDIEAAITALASSGLATEATLSALETYVTARSLSQSREYTIVRDTVTGTIYIRIDVVDDLGVAGLSYLDENFAPVAAPVNPVEPYVPGTNEITTALGLLASEATLANILLDTNALVVDIAAIETELLDQGTTLDAIAVDTANLDVALSTRASEATLAKLVEFGIGEYDYFALTYVASGNGIGEVETVTYKTGGAAGTTIATLTLAYDASNRVISVTKS